MVGKPEGNKPLKRPRGRWECNNKMDFIVIEWIYLAQDRDQ
jgi:hypothetical protein